MAKEVGAKTLENSITRSSYQLDLPIVEVKPKDLLSWTMFYLQMCI